MNGDFSSIKNVVFDIQKQIEIINSTVLISLSLVEQFQFVLFRRVSWKYSVCDFILF